MNSILNYTLKNFKCNKRKNILTIITIILTTCLLTSIGILSYSVRIMNIEHVEQQTGKCHGKYVDLSKKQVDILENNINIKEIGKYVFVADVENKELGSCIMNFLYMDKGYVKMQNVELDRGRLPQKTNEIAVEKWILERLGVKPNLGETVHLKYLTRTKDKNQKPVLSEKDFIVSGILKEDKYARMQYVSNAVVSKEFMEDKIRLEDFKISYYVRLKNDKNIEGNIFRIGKNLGVAPDNISVNEFYIKAHEIDFESALPFIVIGLVVILAAALVIHNIFHISIVEKIKQFGLLAALGSTKKQIKKIIILDGIFTSIIGIPMGILLGHILSYVIIPLTSIEGLTIKTSPYIILVVFIVSLFTVIISLIKPASIASKISPIEAIRFNDAKIKDKKIMRESKKQVNEKTLAYLNLWRNKKRTIMTLLSLTLSGMLFIVFSTIIPSMDLTERVKDDIRSDFQLTSNHANVDDGVSNPFNDDIIKKVKKINGVENTQLLRLTELEVKDKSILGRKDIRCNFYGFDDKMINDSTKYLAEGKISLNDLKNRNEVLLVVQEGRPCYFKVGEKVSLKKIKNNKKVSNDENLEFTVVGIIRKNIEDIGSTCWGSTVFITHKDTYIRSLKDDRPVRLNIDINKNKYDYVKKALKSFQNSNVTLMDYKEVKAEFEKQYRGIKIVSGSIIFIIAIIGILNLINTIVTSIFARKKEIGMLQAVGISDRQLIKTLQIEGMYYALISGLISVIFGTVIGYICFKLLKKSASYAVYKFPLVPLIFLVATLIFVEILITYLTENSLKKDSIVDKIRYNE